jgi:predicted RNA-binding protein with PUA-like domain
MAIWLLKTEPTVYSYSDLERDGETMWDGVNNNTALQNIRKIEKGDMALIYHTGDERQVVGIAEVSRGYYVNPELDDPKMAVCDVKPRQPLDKPITLKQIKTVPGLASSDLVRLGRLSVVPISEDEWEMMQVAGKS